MTTLNPSQVVNPIFYCLGNKVENQVLFALALPLLQTCFEIFCCALKKSLISLHWRVYHQAFYISTRCSLCLHLSVILGGLLYGCLILPPLPRSLEQRELTTTILAYVVFVVISSFWKQNNDNGNKKTKPRNDLNNAKWQKKEKLEKTEMESITI